MKTKAGEAKGMENALAVSCVIQPQHNSFTSRTYIVYEYCAK